MHIALQKSLVTIWVLSKALESRDSHRGLQKHIPSQTCITRLHEHSCGSTPRTPDPNALQKYRDTNGSRIAIQIGGACTTFCQEGSILLQKYRDITIPRCIEKLFESIGVRGRFDWAIPPLRLGLSGRHSGKIPERPRKCLRAFAEISLESTAGIPQTYSLRHVWLPVRFQNSLPLITAGDASFFSNGSGEGLSELVMEFTAVLRAFLIDSPELLTPRLTLSNDLKQPNASGNAPAK